jgi:hypothetical protein
MLHSCEILLAFIVVGQSCKPVYLGFLGNIPAGTKSQSSQTMPGDGQGQALAESPDQGLLTFFGGSH